MIVRLQLISSELHCTSYFKRVMLVSRGGHVDVHKGMGLIEEGLKNLMFLNDLLQWLNICE